MILRRIPRITRLTPPTADILKQLEREREARIERDRRERAEMEDHERRIRRLEVELQGIRNERLTLVVMAMFSAIGIVALLLPARTAPLRGHVQHLVAHVTPVLTPVAAIGAVAALVYGSRCNRRDRRLIDRWHDEHPLSPPGA
jgi:hypothetical protein